MLRWGYEQHFLDTTFLIGGGYSTKDLQNIVGMLSAYTVFVVYVATAVDHLFGHRIKVSLFKFVTRTLLG